MSTSPNETERRASASVLCAMLSETAALLLADEEFALPSAQVLTEDDGDIDTMIAQAVGSLGLCATAMLSGARNAKPSLPGPVFGDCSLVVEICELALTNRSNGGRTALEMAEHAARVLHQAKTASGRMLLVDAIVKYPSPPEPADVCYHVQLKTSEVSIRKRA